MVIFADLCCFISSTFYYTLSIQMDYSSIIIIMGCNSTGYSIYTILIALFHLNLQFCIFYPWIACNIRIERYPYVYWMHHSNWCTYGAESLSSCWTLCQIQAAFYFAFSQKFIQSMALLYKAYYMFGMNFWLVRVKPYAAWIWYNVHTDSLVWKRNHNNTPLYFSQHFHIHLLGYSGLNINVYYVMPNSIC